MSDTTLMWPAILVLALVLAGIWVVLLQLRARLNEIKRGVQSTASAAALTLQKLYPETDPAEAKKAKQREATRRYLSTNVRVKGADGKYHYEKKEGK